MTNAEQPPHVTLRCVGLTKQYGGGTIAVNDVSLDARQGEILALVGPSGCGKTTLLRLVAGLETPDNGTIELDTEVVTGHRQSVPPEKRSVGFVFQDYALFPHMTVARNVSYGLPKNAAGREERVDELLTLVGLSGMRDRRPHQLSGGERQRVALARALAPAPKILLMDEPFSNLDPNLSTRLQLEVRDILHEAGITVVFVTHDQEAALSMGDVIAVMDGGRIQQVGAPDIAFHRPVNRFVAAFLGEADFIPAEPTAVESRVLTELGEAEVSGALTLDFETNMDLMVRPEDLTISADDIGNGRVVGRIFSGAFHAYNVELDSGVVCRAMASHVSPIEVGARVSLRITAGHPLPVFPREARDNTAEPV